MGSRFLRVVLAVLCWSTAAWSHIDLITPEPRSQGNRRLRPADRNSNLKEAPCGQVENGRTDIVHDFVGGETIEVRFSEYVNHESYYRVAFDVDGDDDFPLRPLPAVSSIGDDPRRVFPVDGKNVLAYELEDGAGGEHALNVTLPNVDCDNCTLQLIQYMYDTERTYYFQCADLRITASEANGEVLDAATDFGTLLPPLPPVGVSDEADAGADAGAIGGGSTATGGSASGGGCTLVRWGPGREAALGAEAGRAGGSGPWCVPLLALVGLARRRRSGGSRRLRPGA